MDALIPRILADFRAVAARMQEVDDKSERERSSARPGASSRRNSPHDAPQTVKLIHELERQAGAWSRAQLLRRYLRAARAHSAATGFKVDLQGTPVDFLAWAEHYVNQLDPLHPAA